MLLFSRKLYMILIIKFIQNIELISLFCYISDEEIDVVLSDIEARVSKDFGSEGGHCKR